MHEPEASELLDLAAGVAREAGNTLAEQWSAGRLDVVHTKSSPTDVVTAMDEAAEQLIVRRLRSARPGDGFLGEEGGSSAGSSGVRWIIDPIDGTVNYLYGLPDWAVSVAAEVGGQVVAGVIEIPPRGERYAAVTGRGAWRTDSGATTGELHCKTGVSLDRALVATGFGYSAELRAYQSRVLTGVLPRARDIRRGGSCCVDLCSLASGRVDAYFEQGPKYWDLAAGTLIARESGARVGELDAPFGPRVTVAAAPDLYQELGDLLGSHGHEWKH